MNLQQYTWKMEPIWLRSEHKTYPFRKLILLLYLYKEVQRILEGPTCTMGEQVFVRGTNISLRRNLSECTVLKLLTWLHTWINYPKLSFISEQIVEQCHIQERCSCARYFIQDILLWGREQEPFFLASKLTETCFQTSSAYCPVWGHTVLFRVHYIASLVKTLYYLEK